ncbi:MAG: CDP-alcohol phosphatidyltransferase family protein [Flavobacterium sp.]|nr:CDP-alcohol phosphatidyltransferase family protein [Flavobacterium sp.]
MQFKKYIPNIITLLNLFCGCIAIIFVTQKNFQFAFFFVSLGIFLDFFDGFFARLFHVSSPLGLQLDSLADMVTSGLVPGFTMFVMLANFDIETPEVFPYLGFVITLGACYRLANFNIDTRQTDSFIGLPTPANALLILSLPLILEEDNYHFISELLTSTWFLLLTALSTFMMNAEIALFSLKIKKLNFKDNSLQIGFLLLSILLLFFFDFLGVALVILMYVLLSVFQNILIRPVK